MEQLPNDDGKKPLELFRIVGLNTIPDDVLEGLESCHSNENINRTMMAKSLLWSAVPDGRRKAVEYLLKLGSYVDVNQVRDHEAAIVTKVQKLEPLPLRKTWMNDLAQAVAFLESLNLAHGDLRPENILLDRDRLKLSDFDCTAKIGTDFEACMAPYGRVLNSNEPDQGRRGTAGFLGPRTEQFALGSLYYLINYGFEVYGDRSLTEDPKEHGPRVVNLLQDMKFPELDGDPLIDDIIVKCWHNEYATIAELAAYTRELLPERCVKKESDSEIISIPRWRTIMGRVIRGLWNSVRYWCELVLCRMGARTNLKVVNSGEAENQMVTAVTWIKTT
ncbi:protein kinase-like protein [Metarhizium rileyi]|uniref:Protein kinase-like protein n=1 Tax=Metarhizium rileyi (strain RCEF 4871) TaxID=1649241 RepID=A0A167C2T2_METRR|nr:protein kinase-like protein [Metarhizium rileyi RCEF 4871]